MFVEVHFLQSFVPSNLNRDDAGSPKDCDFGGVRRARISSQCLKRAIRQEPVFAQTTQVPNGIRTKRLVETIGSRFAPEQREQAVRYVEAVVTAFLSKMDGKAKEKTAVLLYMSEGEQEAIHDRLLAEWDAFAAAKDVAKVAAPIGNGLAKQFKGRSSAADIALFGRMLAENPELNIDAACQVAHALSTHRVQVDWDFYTAVDDLQPDDSAGAGMMGYGGFTSACFYRYARIDWEQLVANLGGNVPLARLAVEGFLRAAYFAVPSGKKNSTAPNNLPDLAFAVVRAGGPGLSLANAFEKPVRENRNSGLLTPSAECLDAYFGRTTTLLDGADIVGGAALLPAETNAPHLLPYEVGRLSTWIEQVLSALPEVAS